jgi:hypothetical protein
MVLVTFEADLTLCICDVDEHAVVVFRLVRPDQPRESALFGVRHNRDGVVVSLLRQLNEHFAVERAVGERSLDGADLAMIGLQAKAAAEAVIELALLFADAEHDLMGTFQLSTFRLCVVPLKRVSLGMPLFKTREGSYSILKY